MGAQVGFASRNSPVSGGGGEAMAYAWADNLAAFLGEDVAAEEVLAAVEWLPCLGGLGVRRARTGAAMHSMTTNAAPARHKVFILASTEGAESIQPHLCASGS